MIQGDTIRLKVHFKDFNNKSVDPSSVLLSIYDTNKKQIEQIPIEDTNREDVGVFFYDYAPATELTGFFFEFSGRHNNMPILARDEVKINFN
ncbi:hypothetical protein SAMN05421663_104160 [Terribacillus halophilus]|uniref:Uncharacterized protein n=1 Tax=Terribacillus halophilus TaxID=361279 RepID=A0A1G6PK16_9BACI|nr:hypothetical protein [Terribacillus halophilus]SDC80513.1 hypothetical protein SAMN05421663_104160 [Terribacillus halophilus]